MLIVLPPLAVVLAGVLLRRRGHGPRKALLLAAAFAAAFAVVLTEVLSLFSLLTGTAAALAWGGLDLGLAGWLVREGSGAEMLGDGPDEVGTGGAWDVGFLVGGAVLLGAAVLVLGGFGPANTPDVLTYHLPRIMHWIQNGTVAHYPTWVARQLYMPPGAEYLLLHAVLLGGPGVPVNLLQGFMLALAGLAASLAARRLGGGPAAQGLGGVLVVTLPMGLLQGMTAQNDLVVAVWVLGLVVFTWDVVDGVQGRPEDRLAWGICLGLACLTKATAWIYVLPVVLTVGFLLGTRFPDELARTVPLLVMGPLVLMAGHLVRMSRTFEHPLGSPSVRGLYSNDVVGPRFVASNVVRNLTLQLNTPSERVNGALERGVRRLHQGMGISPDDPRTTWPGMRYRVTRTVPDQDRASNPLHAVLVLLVLAGLAARARRAPPSRVLLGAGLVAAFVGFCAVLKWQPWHARLHLPLFVAAAPLVAVWLEDVLARPWLTVLGGLLLLQGGMVLTVNLVHPVIWTEGNVLTAGRHERMFLKRPSVRTPYRRLADSLRERACHRIGLVWRGTAYEYPLWVLLDPLRTDRTLRHVAPPGLPREGFVMPPWFPGRRAGSGACLWVCAGPGRCDGLRVAATRLDRFGPYSVWRPRGRADQAASSADPSASPNSSRIRRAASSRSSPVTRRSNSPTSETERR